MIIYERKGSLVLASKGKRKERETHLHDLNLGVSLTLADVLSRLDEVADELTRRRRAKLGRVVLLSDEDGPRVDGETESTVREERSVRRK
jgi:hypothetical protein